MSASNDPKQLSPKVIGAAVGGFLLTAVASAMVAITPESMEGLGPWAAPAAMLIGTAGSTALAWWRTDPLRLDYGAQKVAHEGTAAPLYEPPTDVAG